MIGQWVGHYRILSKLGRGGMGEVYRAHDTKLDREVALKVLPPELAGEADRLDRFQREARALAALNHPNIVTIYSVEQAQVGPELATGGDGASHGRTGDETLTARDEDPQNGFAIHFITMELLEGQTLDRHMDLGPGPLPAVLEVAIPIVEALSAAHEKGIVHRDLKPGNVMVTEDGRVKVLDFGLAKLTAQPAATENSRLETDLTIGGSVLGTLAYMSPEQIRGEVVDPRSDLFALGLILFELVTGTHPLRRATPVETASAILQDKLPVLMEIRAETPPQLSRLVGKLLAKDRDSRYQRARDLLNDLRILAEAPKGDAAPAQPAPGRRFSIAVLPFANRSADTENDYLADGLAEDLINELARIKGIKVVARTSAFQFRGREVDVQEIGEKLRVCTVLEGSVRAAGNRLRVTAQLVDAESGFNLWSERFDRERADIFDIQDEITSAIGERIRATVGDEGDLEGVIPAFDAGRNPEAHKALLKGRQRMATMSPAGFESARIYFETALAIDPGYADAHAALSWLTINLSIWAVKDPRPLYEEARRSAQRALEISDDTALAHGCLAFVHMYRDWDWAAAEKAWQRSIELAPSSALLHTYYAFFLSVVGRHEEGVGEAYHALELDPLAGLVNGLVGFTLNGAGLYQEAVAVLDRGIELDPVYWLAYVHRASAYLCLGDYERAAADSQKAFSIVPNPQAVLTGAVALERAGRIEEARELLEIFESLADSPLMRPFHWACLMLLRGQLDEGFEWLDRSLDSKDGLVIMIPEMCSLRDSAAAADPRFAAARVRLGLLPPAGG